MNTANEWLKQSRMSEYPAAKFDKVGTIVEGSIASVPDAPVETQFGTALPVGVANPAYPDGGLTLWVKAGQLAAAISNAAPDGLAVGGTLRVVFVEERDTGKGNPLKVYAASYEPPVKRVDIGSMLGGDS